MSIRTVKENAGRYNKFLQRTARCSWKECRQEFVLQDSQRKRMRDKPGSPVFCCKEHSHAASRLTVEVTLCAAAGCGKQFLPRAAQFYRIRVGQPAYCSVTCRHVGLQQRRMEAIAAAERREKECGDELPDATCSRESLGEPTRYVCCGQTWIFDGMRMHLTKDHGFAYERMLHYMKYLHERDLHVIYKRGPNVFDDLENGVVESEPIEGPETLRAIVQDVVQEVWEETTELPYVKLSDVEYARMRSTSWGKFAIWTTAGVLGLLLAVVPAHAQQRQCTFAWDAPTTDADGNPVTAVDIAGYRLYRATTSGGHVIPGTAAATTNGATTVTAPCASGEFYVVTAVNTQGAESDKSNQVRIQARLVAPAGLRVIQTTTTTSTVVP